MRTLLGMTLLVSVGITTALFFVSVPSAPPEYIHPTVDNLRERESVPTSLDQPNVIGKASRTETFRVISGPVDGPSECVYYKQWLKVENVATKQQAWVAEWLTEPVQSQIRVDNEQFFARVVFEHAGKIFHGLLARVDARLGDAIGVLSTILVGWFFYWLQMQRSRQQMQPVFATAAQSSPPASSSELRRRTALPTGGESRFYGSVNGKPFIARRK